MIYKTLKKIVGLFFSMLNFLMAGNLPPFGCVCAIVEKEKQFLVVELIDGYVVFPGGFMRWHESPEQTLRREGQEETGLFIRAKDLIGLYPCTARSITQMSTLTMVYQAEVVSGTLKKSIEGRPLWIAADALPGKLASDYHRILEEYLRYRAQPDETKFRASGTYIFPTPTNTTHQL
jgi:ADP-ribose pyrophosphatase YjhB (NUDIX family)